MYSIFMYINIYTLFESIASSCRNKVAITEERTSYSWNIEHSVAEERGIPLKGRVYRIECTLKSRSYFTYYSGALDRYSLDTVLKLISHRV